MTEIKPLSEMPMARWLPTLDDLDGLRQSFADWALAHDGCWTHIEMALANSVGEVLNLEFDWRDEFLIGFKP
jgi:hypothetical protein